MIVLQSPTNFRSNSRLRLGCTFNANFNSSHCSQPATAKTMVGPLILRLQRIILRPSEPLRGVPSILACGEFMTASEEFSATLVSFFCGRIVAF